MSKRSGRMGRGLALVMLLQGVLACGQAETSPPVAAPGPAAGPALPPAISDAAPIDPATASGVYQVAGVTVQADTGDQREISGKIELDVTGDRYAVRFDLDTTAPHATRALPAKVRGSGTGYIVDGVFTGTTEERIDIIEEQWPLENIRMFSSSQASFDSQGHFRIQLQNYPGDGQSYTPSVTVMSGVRVADPTTN